MMQGVGLSSGADFLRDAALAHLSDQFGDPPVLIAEEIAPSFKWKPALQLKLNDHLTLVAEVSDTIYPGIFKLRRTDILELQMPISIYCVCPHEVFLDQQDDVKGLMGHGYGLYTVESSGIVTQRFGAIPIIQHISDGDFKEEIKALPRKLKQRLASSFQIYKTSAPAGVTDVTEAVEALVFKAGQEAVKKGWLSQNKAKPGKTAETLNAMAAASQFNNAIAAIGGAQSYISRYRNTAHHPPKDKKQAFRKHRDCRHGFLEGLKGVQYFYEAMRNIGLSGLL